jgi:peptidoglycan/xylan/chitin deacetylase (PgdA/CDA1 family)
VVAAIKRPLEGLLASSIAGALARPRIQGKRLVLAYHGIRPDGEPSAGERTLFVRRSDFARQLDILADGADVVSLNNLYTSESSSPQVAITFDDAYLGALDGGVAELSRRNLPATMFVAPGRLGHTFWWDAISPATETLDESIRSHALQKLGGVDERVREWATTQNIVSPTLPAYARSGTLGEIHDAIDQSGLTVGSHSWSHANLALLGEAELATELQRSRRWLKDEFGSGAGDWLAYPYGISSPAVRRAAEQAHYFGAFRIGGGWHARNMPPFERPRLSVSANLSLNGFRSRVLGVLNA